MEEGENTGKGAVSSAPSIDENASKSNGAGSSTATPNEFTRRSSKESIRHLAIQFCLLLWKDIILQVRRPLGTLVEIMLPLIVVIVLIILRFTLSTIEKCFATFDSDSLNIPQFTPYTIYYAPNTTEVNILANNFMAPLLAPSGGSVFGVPTSSDLISYAANSTRDASCFIGGAGVYFTDIEGDNVRYSIRLRGDPGYYRQWFTTKISINTVDLFGQQILFFGGPRIAPNSYTAEGFVHLQKIVNEAIIEYKTGEKVGVDVEIRELPYPHHLEDSFPVWNSIIFSLMITLSFVYSVGTFIQELVLEKESRVKETMKIMGLQNWVLWTTWFLKQTAMLIPIVIVLSLLLKFGEVLPNSDLFLIIVFFILYVISVISFCFLFSSFFSSATLGLMAGILCWSVLSLVQFFISVDAHIVIKIIFSLSPGVAGGLGLKMIQSLEHNVNGYTFETFFESSLFGNSFNMGWIFILLVIDTITHMILYW
jgi:ATP-binding cassette subfamily A (ABC1) protein 3